MKTENRWRAKKFVHNFHLKVGLGVELIGKLMQEEALILFVLFRLISRRQ